MPSLVIVTSKNPAKIEAVRFGFEKMFPNQEFEFVGIAAPSGVSDQPMSDQETLQGAINRNQHAKTSNPKADFYVSLEGGVEFENHDLYCFGWAVVESHGQFSKSRTGIFRLPPKVARLVESGIELGTAEDMVFGTTDSKKSNGSVGILTNNAYTRADFYAQAIAFALIPFVHAELFKVQL